MKVLLVVMDFVDGLIMHVYHYQVVHKLQMQFIVVVGKIIVHGMVNNKHVIH